MNTGDAAELRGASLRLALQFSALVLVLFAVLAGVTFFVVGASQSEAATRTLVDAGLVDSTRDAPPNVLVAIQSGYKLQITRSAPSWFPEADAMRKQKDPDDVTQTTLSEGGHSYIVRTSIEKGRVVQTAIDNRENTEELQRLGLALLISGILAVLASAVIAAVMARRAMRPMIEALNLQRRFVADASHELRTPLTLLTTRAQLLRRRLGERDATEGTSAIGVELDMILQDSRDLTEILEDLLITADPRETGESIPLDVNALLGDAVADMESEAQTRRIEMRWADVGRPLIVRGGRASLSRMCKALIVNALDHAEHLVVIEARPRAKSVELRFSDDGPGFPEGMEHRAFVRFATSRGGPSRGQKPRHYGIGLALVADVAARNGGRVGIESAEPGAGAVITVILPLTGS